MKSNQFLNEHSYTDDGIIRVLVDKGFRLMGSGVDQTAFLSPDGQVLKIFGTQSNTMPAQPTRGRPDPVFSKDQMMFFTFVKFCESNSTNEFLPKFGGFESFYWDGRVYLQIYQERLHSCGYNKGSFYEYMADNAESEMSFGQFFENMQKRLSESTTDELWGQRERDNRTTYSSDIPSTFQFDPPGNTGRVISDKRFHDKSRIYQSKVQFDNLLKLIGEQKMKLFYETITILSEIGEEKGYRLDLHGGNFMLRDNGWPVIVDPWAVRGSRD